MEFSINGPAKLPIIRFLEKSVFYPHFQFPRETELQEERDDSTNV